MHLCCSPFCINTLFLGVEQYFAVPSRPWSTKTGRETTCHIRQTREATVAPRHTVNIEFEIVLGY